jgi:branched-chain amino acid transport system substrate-binding protein
MTGEVDCRSEAYGPLSFDANGDLSSHVVSVFQVKQNNAYPVNDAVHQFKYIGMATADTT